MGVSNRKAIRMALASALRTHLTQAKFVASYLADPQGQSPAITVSSRGTAETSVGINHLFTVHLLVVAGKIGTDWTQERAEAMLDDLRHAFDLYLPDCVYRPERDGTSVIEMVEIPEGGEPYLHEAIPIRVAELDPR